MFPERFELGPIDARPAHFIEKVDRYAVESLS